MIIQHLFLIGHIPCFHTRCGWCCVHLRFHTRVEILLLLSHLLMDYSLLLKSYENLYFIGLKIILLPLFTDDRHFPLFLLRRISNMTYPPFSDSILQSAVTRSIIKLKDNICSFLHRTIKLSVS